jgi:hypothetical protein
MQKKKIVAVQNVYPEITANGYLFHNQNAPIGHDLLRPWNLLYETLTETDIELLTLDQAADVAIVDCIVFMDRPSLHEPKEREILAREGVIKYLILYENPMIYPANWDVDFHTLFDKVFTWNDSIVDNQRYFKLNYTCELRNRVPYVISTKEYHRKKLFCLISSNKIIDHPNSAYSKRVELINYFENHQKHDFDLWGKGWGGLGLSVYKGETIDKVATGSNYRFQFAIENSTGYDGYITEKIFDCFKSGVIPVYLGPENITDHIPDGAFVDLRSFDSVGALFERLKNWSHEEYLEKAHNIEKFLNSEDFEPFSNQFFVATICHHLRSDLAKKGTSIGNDIPENGDQRRTISNPYARLHVDQTWVPRKLYVVVGYGSEMEVFTRARNVWRRLQAVFDQVSMIFIRDCKDTPLGMLFMDGEDLVVGTKCSYSHAANEGGGYAETGVWSAEQNFSVLYRQIVIMQHLLNTNKDPFYVYFSTVTSVVDMRGISLALDVYRGSEVFAGMPGRLSQPKTFEGLTFVCGTNCLVSSEIIRLMCERYKFGDPSTFLPNDIWQAVTLDSAKRQVLPFFTFETPLNFRISDELEVRRKARLALQAGHFHFRIKTSDKRYSQSCNDDIKPYRREDVDPLLMNIVIDEVQSHKFSELRTKRLIDSLSVTTTNSLGGVFHAFAEPDFLTYARDFPLNDTEIW